MLSLAPPRSAPWPGALRRLVGHRPPRRLRARLARAGRLGPAQARADALAAAAEAFDSGDHRRRGGRARLSAGDEALGPARSVSGSTLPRRAAGGHRRPGANSSSEHARRLEALFAKGQACDFEAGGLEGGVAVEGRALGAVAWLRLSPIAPLRAGLPTAALLAALIDARARSGLGRGRRRHAGVGQRGLALRSRGREPRGRRGRRARLWILPSSRRSARPPPAARRASAPAGSPCRGPAGFADAVHPLEGGGVGVWTQDVSRDAELAESLKRLVAAHDLILGTVGDAVAVFGRDKRLAFHNPAFAALWRLEPAWLAEHPSTPNARPPAPAPPPARDGRLRPLQGRRAGPLRAPASPTRDPVAAPGEAAPSRSSASRIRRAGW